MKWTAKCGVDGTEWEARDVFLNPAPSGSFCPACRERKMTAPGVLNWRQVVEDSDMLPLPSASPVKTKEQRQTESRAAHADYFERQEKEYERQRDLPSLEDKVQAINVALTTLLAVIHHQVHTGKPIDPLKIIDITEELIRVTGKETRNG